MARILKANAERDADERMRGGFARVDIERAFLDEIYVCIHDASSERY